jgi:hypothetical protein
MRQIWNRLGGGMEFWRIFEGYGNFIFVCMLFRFRLSCVELTRHEMPGYHDQRRTLKSNMDMSPDVDID